MVRLKFRFFQLINWVLLEFNALLIRCNSKLAVSWSNQTAFQIDENMKWLSNLFKRDDAKPKPDDMVRVYDPTTKTITEMPASQLTPNMIQAQVEGMDGVHWIDAGELKMGEHQAESFPEDIRDLFRDIKSKLNEVYPMSLEQWEDGFLRDANPEHEIALWLHVADIYSRLTSERGLSLEQKKDYFRVLGTCMNSARERVLQLFRPQLISEAEAEKVIAAYYGEKS